jgi:transposase
MAFFVRPLTLHEQQVIKNLCEAYQDTPLICRRFQIILLSHQRLKTTEISQQLKVRPDTVLYWVKRFNREGIACFEKVISRDPASPLPALPNSEPLFARGLTQSETEQLQQLSLMYKERIRIVKRFQVILLSSQNIQVSEIARHLGLSQKTIRLWIKQFNTEGIYGLETLDDKNWLKRSVLS